MARYTGPDCKRCRREKTKLFLKGAKCDSPKCPIEIRPYPPGEHGRIRARENNDYLLQVREKQKAKRIYGILEKQFHNYYEEATHTRGRTGEAMLQIRILSGMTPSHAGTVRSPASACATMNGVMTRDFCRTSMMSFSATQ